MRPQYVFSLVAVVATVALFWRPKPPSPLKSTREENGLEVRITKHAEPHRFEELPVPSLENPAAGVFLLPKSYLRMRLCAGDDAMVAAVQARLLVAKEEGSALAKLVARCGPRAPLCSQAVAALEVDGGLNAEELGFFASALLECDKERFAELRTDPRLPLDLRERAWLFLADAGEWSPALDALVDEHLANYGPNSEPYSHFRVASVINNVRSESPALLDASVRLMERSPTAMRLLQRAQSPAVRSAACARLGCDAGSADPIDSGIDRREELAACVLQADDGKDEFCLDRLVELDWSMARSVATRRDSDSSWVGALRAFETREAFDQLARSVAATPQPDGGFNPELLLGELTAENMAQLYSADGLGTDELAAQWASLAPELKQAFFFESSDGEGGLRLSGRMGDDLFEVAVRRERDTVDPRAALSLLNVMVAEQESPRRFFLLKSGWGHLTRFAEPERVSKLLDLGIIALEDPEEARKPHD